MMKLRLRVCVLPPDASSPAKPTTFLLLSSPESSLRELSAAIVIQYERNYPDKA